MTPAAGFCGFSIAAAVLGLLIPEWQIYAGSVANAVIFGALAWLWSPKQMKRT